LDRETERMAKGLKKELHALRVKAKQKKNLKVMKAYQKLASTLR
jgi:hypothetical protein